MLSSFTASDGRVLNPEKEALFVHGAAAERVELERAGGRKVIVKDA